MSTHTPGPWRCGPINWADIYAPNGDLVALVIKGRDESPANSRLVIAAPDLLLALQNAETFIARELEIMERSFEPNPNGGEEIELSAARDLLVQVREAIRRTG